MTRITATKQAALTANTVLGPINESQTPPRAGPRIPDMFSCNPPSVAAERSSLWETISGTIEDDAQSTGWVLGVIAIDSKDPGGVSRAKST